jgi:hypothetical protein
MATWPFWGKKSVEPPVPNTSPQGDKVMSFLSPKEVQSLGGLPNEAIAGFMLGDTPTTETFRPNPLFIEFMHRVIRTAAPFDPDLCAAAREQRDGWVYITDLRTLDGPPGRIPPEDIIGAFQVQNGEIIPDSYAANALHRILATGRLVCLPPSLRTAFVAQLPKVR